MSETQPSATRAPDPARPRPRASRLTVQIIVLLIVAIALAALLTFCAKKTPAGAAPGGGAGGGAAGGRHARGGAGGAGGRPAITVGIAKAVSGSVPIDVSALGTVTPVATVNVVPRVGGQLTQVAFREGQLVHKGQLLVQIDPRPFAVVVQQARAQLQRDQALLQNARLDLTRYRTLNAEDSIARQTLETQASLVQQDLATVAADQATVASAQLNLSYARITSPVSGRVGLRQVDPGNQITANQSTPVAVVTQIDPITVIFSLPEVDIPPVQKQGGAGLAVTAYDRAGGTALAHGALLTLDNVVDTTTGTVKARARFANGAGALFPNQFVNVVMLVDTLANQVIVPTTATRHGPQGDFIWVLQPNKTVKSRIVKVGPGTAETISIISGLNVGETVITDGGDRLRDGSPVVLPGQRPGGAGGYGGGHGGHRRGGGGGPAAG